VLSVIVNLRMASPVVSQDLEYPEEEKARRLKWREWLLAAYGEQPESLDGPLAKYVEILDGQCFAGGCEGEAEPLHLLCLSCKEKQRQKKKLNKETCSIPGCDRPRETKMQSSYCEEHRKIYHRVRSRKDYAKKILQGGIYEREVSGADVLPEGLVERAENQQPEL